METMMFENKNVTERINDMHRTCLKFYSKTKHARAGLLN
jgi:hypothetical protein